MEWLPIESAPKTPCAVVYFCRDVEFYSFPDGRKLDNPVIHKPDHMRGEACDVGYWDGEYWCYSNSNHRVFEFGDDVDLQKPTHWLPLPNPPSPVLST